MARSAARSAALSSGSARKRSSWMKVVDAGLIVGGLAVICGKAGVVEMQYEALSLRLLQSGSNERFCDDDCRKSVV